MTNKGRNKLIPALTCDDENYTNSSFCLSIKTQNDEKKTKSFFYVCFITCCSSQT
jgi:hypothetical protein